MRQDSGRIDRKRKALRKTSRLALYRVMRDLITRRDIIGRKHADSVRVVVYLCKECIPLVW